MNQEQIIAYINEQRDRGVTDEHIRDALIASGWPEDKINEGFQSANSKPVRSTGSVSNVARTFGDAWHIYTKRFLTLAVLAIIPLAADALVFGLVFFYAITVLGVAAVSSVPNALGGGSLIVALVFAIALALGLIVLGTWIQLALVEAVRTDEPISVGQALKNTWGKKIFLWWVIAFWQGAILLGGFLLFVIPAVIFGVWFTFSKMVFIVEGETGLNALIKSREYVRGYWWEIFGNLVLLGVIALAVQFFLSFIPLVGQIGYYLLTPFATAYIFVLYRNLKEMRELHDFTPPKQTRTWFTVIGVVATILICLFIFFISFEGTQLLAHWQSWQSTLNTIPSPTILQDNSAALFYSLPHL